MRRNSSANRALEARGAISDPERHPQPHEQGLWSADTGAVAGCQLNQLLPEAIQTVQNAVDGELCDQIQHVLLVGQRVAVPSSAQV